MRKILGVAALVAALVLSAALPALAAHRPDAAAASLSPHDPIVILGNTGFNASNGVVGGIGTASNPYVIAGWIIDAPPSMGVQIRGTDAHAVVRDVAVTGAPTAGFYTFDVSNVTFANVTALGSAGDGLRLESSNEVEILKSNASANGNGIAVVGSWNVTVSENNVTLNREDGIVISQSTAILVQSNLIAYGGLFGGYGLDLASSTNVSVLANRFTGGGIYLQGTAVAHFATHTITADNQISGLPILYVADRTGFTLSGLQLGELLIAGCAHAAVANLTTAGGDLGVEVAFSTDVTLAPNLTLADAALGLLVVASSSVRFADGAILDTGSGASVQASTDVAISGSKISAPFASTGPGDAIDIVGSDRVNISFNVLRHHLTGVFVASSGNVSLIGNVASLNAFGLQFDGAYDVLALGNLLAGDQMALNAATVSNATFAGNGFDGAYLGANVSGSQNLTFLHNAFIGDTIGAHDANGTADRWDGGYPTGGNYWANYTGVDHCSGAAQNVCTGPDGIGDTPYVFAANATDRYPLMHSPALADVPPEALFYVIPSVGTVITTFTASANLSSDYEDPLDALLVRWDWQGNGAWTPWSAAKSSSHTYGVPGTYPLTLEVRDRANLTDSWTTQIFVAPKPDNVPPAIKPRAPATVDVGVPIVVTANITDPSGVQNATLLYRGVDGGPFRGVPMFIEIDGVNFTATIPAQPHAGTVEYVIVANDTWENEARAPVSGTSAIAVADPLGALLVYFIVPAAVGVAAVIAAFLLWRRHKRKPPLPEAEPAARPGP